MAKCGRRRFRNWFANDEPAKGDLNDARVELGALGLTVTSLIVVRLDVGIDHVFKLGSAIRSVDFCNQRLACRRRRAESNLDSQAVNLVFQFDGAREHRRRCRPQATTSAVHEAQSLWCRMP